MVPSSNVPLFQRSIAIQAYTMTCACTIMFQRPIAGQAYTVTCPCAICSNCPLPFKLTLWHVHVKDVPTAHCRSNLHCDMYMSIMFQRPIAVQTYTVTCPCQICSNGPLPFKLTLWHVHVQYVPTVHCRSSVHCDLSMSNMFQRSIAFQT